MDKHPSSRPVNGNTQPWTATRCHRLLRPLLTHVAALRKEIHSRQACRLENDPSQEPDGERAAASKRPLGGGGSFTHRKRARYTYSFRTSKTTDNYRGANQRHQNGKAPVTQPRYGRSKEGLILPTPLIKRVRGHQVSSPVQVELLGKEGPAEKGGRCHHGHDCYTNRCVFELELAALRRKTAPARFSLYESIFRALDALLRATSKGREAPGFSRSLLSMCLRKVPDYVVEIEYWERKDAQDNGALSALDGSDVSFKIYSELELLGTGNSGWSHLATVVWAHGIKIVKGAISEGLIDLEFSVLLARLCNESSSFPDRAELVEAIVCRQYPRPSGPDDWFASSKETTALEFLLPLSGVAWMEPFRARILTDLIDRQLLPREWMLTRDFGTIWSCTVRDLAQKNTNQDSIAFVTTSIRALSKYADSKSCKDVVPSRESLTDAQQSLIRALAALAAIAILSQQTLLEGSTEPNVDRVRVIKRRVEYIFRGCLGNTRLSVSNRTRPGTYVLLLVAFFLDPAFQPPETDETLPSDFWGRWADHYADSRWKWQYEATLSLTCSMAQACGTGGTEPAYVHLNKLCDQLETVNGTARRIRQDAAFYLAEQTADLRDLAFAESLCPDNRKNRGASSAMDKPQQTPGRKTAFAGFRWDEGISEWVTESPIVKVARRRAVREHTDELATEPPQGPISTSWKEKPAQRRKTDTPPASCSTGGSRLPGTGVCMAGTTCHEGETKNSIGSEETARRAKSPKLRWKSRRQGTGSGEEPQAPSCFRPIATEDDDLSLDDELWMGEWGARRKSKQPPQQPQPQRANRKDEDKENYKYRDNRDKDETRRSSCSTERTIGWHTPTKRLRARASLPSQKPLRATLNVYSCYGVSDDELG